MVVGSKQKGSPARASVAGLFYESRGKKATNNRSVYRYDKTGVRMEKRRPGRWAIQILGLAAALLLPVGSHAQTVEGRILEEQGLTNQFPAAFIPLTLKTDEGGRSAPVYTTRWGRFFFDGVEPGEYTLEIWMSGYKRGRPVTREISVPDRDHVEVDPILVDPEFSP